jgi:ABC-type nitrate/sulfonate/bicarbonate transport system substrate-binding protein
LYISFYNNWTYLGDIGDENDDDDAINIALLKKQMPEIASTLKQKHIDYFLVWDPYNVSVNPGKDFELLGSDSIDEVTIYRIKN